MNKSKLFKKIAGVLSVTIIVLIVVSCSIFSTSYEKVFPNPEYYSDDELRKILHENKPEFEEIVEIILDNEGLARLIREGGDGSTILYDWYDYLFTEEEWDKIVKFHLEFKPSQIMRFGTSTVLISFGANDAEARNDLFYYATSKEDGYTPTWYDSFESIEDNWWMSEIYAE